MIIELFKVKVAPVQKQYLEKDTEIWTQALVTYPGFLGKEVWLNPNKPSEVILVIRWASREQWKSVSIELLDAIEQQFAQALGDIYQIVELSEYQVHKFRQS